MQTLEDIERELREENQELLRLLTHEREVAKLQQRTQEHIKKLQQQTPPNP